MAGTKRARRGRGEGSISQRGDGLWVGRITIGRDATGKRKRKAVYGKTKAEALQKLDEERAKAAAGFLVDTKSMTFADWLDQWLATKTDVRKSTLRDYRNTVDKHIKPTLGTYRLEKLGGPQLRSWFAQDHLAHRTKRRAHGIMRMVFGMAVKDRLLAFNPMDAVPRPRDTRREMGCLDATQAATLVETAMKHRLGSVVVLGVSCGLRIGEALALWWEDVDLDAGRLHIRHTLLHPELERGEPKTSGSRRSIALPTVAREALVERKAWAMREGNAASPWVHSWQCGSPVDKGNFHNHVWSPMRAALGLDVRFHDLRHTAATLLLAAKIPVLTVSKMLGHASAKMTLDRYGHVLPSMEDEAADAMDAVLAG